MKILVCTNFLPPRIGGIERHTLEIVNALSSNDLNDVTVITHSYDDEESQKYLSKKVTLISCPSFVIAHRLPFPNFLSLKFYRLIFQRSWKYDLVVLQSHLFVLNWIVSFLCRRSPKRLWMNHGSWFIKLTSPILQVCSVLYEKLGMLILKRTCNYFAAQGTNAAKWASKQTSLDFKVIFNSINVSLIRNQQSSFDRRMNSILVVSRLIPGKGIENALKVFSELKFLESESNSKPNWTLSIVGPGELDILVKNRESEGIAYFGSMEHDEVLKQMQQHEFLLQVFDEPGDLTTVMLEAIACGMYVVSTPIGNGKKIQDLPNLSQVNFDEIPRKLHGKEFDSRVDEIESIHKYLDLNFSWSTASRQFEAIGRIP